MNNSTVHKFLDDFILIENAVSREIALELTQEALLRGQDGKRGFSCPKLKPNRPGIDLDYPVKKYMCYGLYWDPSTYQYYETVPGTNLSPFSIPKSLIELSYDSVKHFFPHHLDHFKIDTCFVNFYTKDKTGKDSTIPLHKDKEEPEKKFPIIGLSLGSTAHFLYQDLKGEVHEIFVPDRSLYLFGDSMRLMRHGVKEVLPDTLPQTYSTFLTSRERLNFNLRKVY